jgi:hypothetical protein
MNGNQLPIFGLEEVRQRLAAGIQEFLLHESKLFAARIGERAMCSHLEEYLKITFAPWDADFEYDSFGDEAKRSPIGSRKKNKHPRGHLVTPDLIVHEPLNPHGNLLAIEAKKQNNAKGITADREKLHSYQGPPLLLIFGAEKVPVCTWELFQADENPEIPKNSTTLTAPPFQP